MSYDRVSELREFSDRRDIRYTLLSDRKSKIIPAFGLLNEDFEPGSPWHGIAHPMTLVVDAKGIVRHRFSRRRYSRRPEIDDVLAALRKGAGG